MRSRIEIYAWEGEEGYIFWFDVEPSSEMWVAHDKHIVHGKSLDVVIWHDGDLTYTQATKVAIAHVKGIGAIVVAVEGRWKE